MTDIGTRQAQGKIKESCISKFRIDSESEFGFGQFIFGYDNLTVWKERERERRVNDTPSETPIVDRKNGGTPIPRRTRTRIPRSLGSLERGVDEKRECRAPVSLRPVPGVPGAPRSSLPYTRRIDRRCVT